MIRRMIRGRRSIFHQNRRILANFNFLILEDFDFLEDGVGFGWAV